MANNVTYFENDEVVVAFTNRLGGTSKAPYDSLNLGIHVEDDFGDVIRNRELLYNELSKRYEIPKNSSWGFLNQTHENRIVNFDAVFNVDNENPPTADASITSKKQFPLVVMTADCGPLAIYTKSVVAVVHASWRSVRSGIIESIVDEFKYLVPNEKIKSILGPCIHSDNYEFDPQLLDELKVTLGDDVATTTIDSKPAFDLVAAIENKLEDLNVSNEIFDIDTFSNKNYFSYRRDGVTGRQGVIAWLK
ncbi:MAG: polyphenol oxidase family protein [Acidimicrobiia bacterium]